MSTAATRVLIRAAEACAARPEPHEIAALMEALVDRVLEHRAETYPPQVRAPAITHAEGSPLLRADESFAGLHAARLVPRTVLLDGRGDAAPRNPEDQGDGA